MNSSKPSRNGILAIAILLITLVGLSLSLFIPLLSIDMERMAIAPTLSGLNTAIGGIGTICTVPFVPRLAQRFGLRRVIALAIIVAALTAIGFYWLPFWLWFTLRFLFGASIGTLFVLSEYWINAAAPDDKRGLVMGIYATFLSLGFAAGPLLLGLTGTQGMAPYLVGACIMLLALLPLIFGQGETPQIEGGSSVAVHSFLRTAPVATCAALVFGAIETGGFALFPVYGLRNAMTEITAAGLISLVAAGNIVSQIPLGWLSDRIERPRLLLICASVGVIGCIAMPLTISTPGLFFTVLFIWGGFTGGLYSVGLAHLGARFKGADLATANAAFVMLYSVGMIAGPPVVGAGMDLVGSQGFAMALGLMLLLYAMLVMQRLFRQQA